MLWLRMGPCESMRVALPRRKCNMKYTYESLLNSTLDRRLSGTAVNEITSCHKCTIYIEEICCKMAPSERQWFRRCLAEIEQSDGHVILERFLRLYRMFPKS
jgi:hypothetical protein